MKLISGTVLCFLGAALLVVGGTLSSFRSFRQIQDVGRARDRAHLVMDHGITLLSSMKDAETGYRGYLLTGDTAFLEPYLTARDSVRFDAANLRLACGNAAAQARLDAMAPLMELKLANMARSIRLRRTAPLADALLDETSGHGKTVMDGIRAEMSGFLQVEQAELDGIEAVFQAGMRQMLVVISATSGLSLLLAMALVYFFNKEARQQVKSQVYLETRNLLEELERMNARLTCANNTLQENEARLRVTLNSIGDAVLTTDAQGRITILNPLAETYTGWTQAEALGRPVEEVFRIINQETRLPSLIPVKETLAQGIVHGLANHTVLLARNGGECAIADSCAPIRTPDGEVIGAILVFRDVTEDYARRAELEKAKQVAEKASLAKSDFLSSMSHEIRTPMNAIIGMSYLALKTELTPRQRDYLKKIKGSSQHLLGIINDILDFSKIEANKLTLENTEFELEKVLDNVANLITDKTAGKGLELVFDIDKNVPPTLIGDPLRLGQILINYGNNAVKFTETGEIDIVIRLREQTEDEVLLYFAVRDTGIGISGEEIGRLFQSFSQADPSITRKFGGTGLGLVIAKKLADLMGGEVGVLSELGKGSTFWFTARFAKASAQQRKLVLSSDLRGKRVLVVDDLNSARLVLGKMLSSLGFKVDLAESGQAALEAMTLAERLGNPFEVVLLDWLMPGMDGIEMARRAKEAMPNHKSKLMMVTAYGREEVIRSAEAMGIKHVLIKPVSASLLFDSIVNILGGTSDGPRKALMESTDTFERLASLRNIRVLLVEDNDLNQEVATALLKDAGFSVDLAGNGQVAVALVRAHAYDIVLMDVQMPVMDGLTATRQIRLDPAYRDLPVVAMTANAMVGDRDRCLAAGMNDHIAKPIDPEDLWKVLLKWIQPHPASLPEPPLAPAAMATEPPLPAIEGLDMATALHRVLGKQALYLSMLRKFKAGQRAVPEGIRQALEEGDWATAERIAHTLKGVAGTIGATRLQTLAAALEAALEVREADLTADRLQDLEGPLADLLARLEQALPVERVRPAVNVDPDLLREVCGRLRIMLADDDGEAGDLLETHGDLLCAAFPDHFQMLQDTIRSFAFEEALAVLKAATGARR